MNGKSDTLDAQNAAGFVLASFATVIPRTADIRVEMIRQLKVAHDSAVTDRSAAMIPMKAMLVHADDTAPENELDDAGGHRQLSAAIYRTAIVRMGFHGPTIAYVARRTAEGKSKRAVIRCLKRYVIREVYHLIKVDPAWAKSPVDN